MRLLRIIIATALLAVGAITAHTGAEVANDTAPAAEAQATGCWTVRHLDNKGAGGQCTNGGSHDLYRIRIRWAYYWGGSGITSSWWTTSPGVVGARIPAGTQIVAVWIQAL